MKTTKYFTLALAAMCALGASALADQQPNQKAKMSGTKVQKTEKTSKTWDSQSQPLRTIGYPVVFLERTGHSLMHSPQIVSDTFKGKRNLVSKKGVMTERDTKKGTPKMSSTKTEKSSTATKRG
ncbi:hypothetical protein CfE428DRAFT_6543 [Chthoniobacter flavus Ellin428]|uniref:Uncharacterized protein n=1 Tax=Chthoniobacter flavus Ellin428 TaxID=497964 RepID=B4DCA2_9BACT|nr:hypothetical protein [Chthoniobacter flavus]EDY15932.1 hypothetical protein CfE428DRAFT_6543 [Chthoniobacter flavus Ellin428]TCO82523.1 hypothetical protein EV701_14612 [Chthoniobacter flavus]